MSPAFAPLCLPGLVVPPASAAVVRRLIGEPHPFRGFPYPWAGLENYLATSPAGPNLPLVGYGSLLSPVSASRTLKHPVSRQRVSVVAFGVRRVFNYGMPESPIGNYGPPAAPLARAALNAYITGNLADVLNGVLVPVDLSDVAGLREREDRYDLSPVWCLRWDRPDEPALPGYVLCSPDEPPQGVRHTDNRLLPHDTYYQLCRTAAAGVSKEFLRFFLETTFLADRETPVGLWEASRGGETP